MPHAQNLRESGVNVVVGQRPGGPNYDLAKADGFEPLSAAEAAAKADLIMILTPDQYQKSLYENDIKPSLKKGDVLAFAHGFNVHFEQIVAPADVDVVMIAPKGPGHLVRRVYTQGGAVPALIAVAQDASGKAKEIALAYAKGIGSTRSGVLETTFREETETDLFGEQAVLCGGCSELIKAGFETLVEAGVPAGNRPTLNACTKMKLIVDLLYEGGLSHMRWSISDTAEYGDYTRGPRVITDETRAEMRKILKEIQQGEFARDFILENQSGNAHFKAMRRINSEHKIEEVGGRLREMMQWLKK